MNTIPSCRITPLDVGLCMLGEGHVLGSSYSDDDRIAFVLYSFLIQAPDNRNILVDLGPKTLEYTNEMFRRFNFFRTFEDGSRPDDIVQRYGNVLDQLPRFGLTQNDITDVAFTHLHADHHGMDDAKDGGMCEDFPNARFYVSRNGWEFHLSQRKEGNWNSYLDWGLGDFLLRAEREGRAVFEDDREIVPGVSTVYLGGHSVCSQGVRVQTDLGPVIITGDDVYRYDLLSKGIMAGISSTPERLLETTHMLTEMVMEEKAVLVPVHDPVISDLYRDHAEGWVQRAGKLSVLASEGFRSSPQYRAS